MSAVETTVCLKSRKKLVLTPDFFFCIVASVFFDLIKSRCFDEQHVELPKRFHAFMIIPVLL